MSSRSQLWMRNTGHCTVSTVRISLLYRKTRSLLYSCAQLIVHSDCLVYNNTKPLLLQYTSPCPLQRVPTQPLSHMTSLLTWRPSLTTTVLTLYCFKWCEELTKDEIVRSWRHKRNSGRNSVGDWALGGQPCCYCTFNWVESSHLDYWLPQTRLSLSDTATP
jgi:hypothetical protein